MATTPGATLPPALFLAPASLNDLADGGPLCRSMDSGDANGLVAHRILKKKKDEF